MQIDWNQIMTAVTTAIVESVLFTIVGVVLFTITFIIIEKLAPGTVRKELEEDQNVAIGIVIGAAIIGFAMIVSAALHG